MTWLVQGTVGLRNMHAVSTQPNVTANITFFVCFCPQELYVDVMCLMSLSNPWRYLTLHHPGANINPNSTETDRRVPAMIDRDEPASLSSFGRGDRNSALQIVAGVGKYPEGAKLLTGSDRKYIIAPLGNIVEEKYSPYLEWVSVQGRGNMLPLS